MNERSWPHQPTTPPPTITLTTYQAQRILRSLACGFATTDELTWLADQLGPDHIAHPTEPLPKARRILDAIYLQAAKDRDLYKRGYQAGQEEATLIALDQTWGKGYEAGYHDGKVGNKPNPAPPDEAGHMDIAML